MAPSSTYASNLGQIIEYIPGTLVSRFEENTHIQNSPLRSGRFHCLLDLFFLLSFFLQWSAGAGYSGLGSPGLFLGPECFASAVR